jgi:pimeloyl-ACP methyl ester carboxylesterase
MRDVQVDEHCWVYLEGGKGEAVLFVPGFGMEKDAWGRFLIPFSRSYRLVVPDLPGFGESSHVPSASYDVPSQVHRLHRFVETIDLPSFHLVGISLGGYISGYYAGEHPEKVKSLALMDPAGVESRIPSHAMALYRKEGQIVLLYRTVEEWDALVENLFYRPPPIPGPFKKFLAERGARNYPFHEKILRDLEHRGMNLLEGRLSRISARTLLLWGENDRILHVSGVEKFQKGVSNNRVVIVKNCGHVPFFEKRKETVRAYQAFLRTLQAEQAPGR